MIQLYELDLLGTQTAGRKVGQVDRVRKWSEKEPRNLKRKGNPAPDQHSGHKLNQLIAFRAPGSTQHRGFLIAGSNTIRCALGHNGVSFHKREGDGCSPTGSFHLLQLFWRRDRAIRRPSSIPLIALRPDQIWCDDPASRLYNRFSGLPLRESHERLWREDRLYDVIGILDYNLRPRIRGAGSAIFFHLSDAQYGPTAGCVAISAADMRRLLPRLAKTAKVTIR